MLFHAWTLLLWCLIAVHTDARTHESRVFNVKAEPAPGASVQPDVAAGTSFQWYNVTYLTPFVIMDVDDSLNKYRSDYTPGWYWVDAMTKQQPLNLPTTIPPDTGWVDDRPQSWSGEGYANLSLVRYQEQFVPSWARWKDFRHKPMPCPWSGPTSAACAPSPDVLLAIAELLRTNTFSYMDRKTMSEDDTGLVATWVNEFFHPGALVDRDEVSRVGASSLADPFAALKRTAAVSSIPFATRPLDGAEYELARAGLRRMEGVAEYPISLDNSLLTTRSVEWLRAVRRARRGVAGAMPTPYCASTMRTWSPLST